VKDKIIVGAAGGEYGIRGFIAAYDPKTGKEIWKFYTIPGPGEPGHETWPTGDAWMHGGASVWITGSYDASLNLTYWGVGNPGPDFNPKQRAGDNLYASSVVALDADSGKLRWHFQFTPNDPYDYDSVQVPVLADAVWSGKMRKLMFWANRNGFFYVLDRTNGEFLSGHPFVKVNWASGLDDSGRPVQTPQPEGKPTYPGPMGGTNWYSPSYSPRTGLFYVSAFEDYGGIFHREDTEYKEGQRFSGPGTTPAMPGWPNPAGFRAALINNWTDEVGHGAVIALDIHTGQPKWKYRMTDTTDAGILTTASDVLFTGSHEGFFQVLDARTGALLWKSSVGGQSAAPMTFELDGKQYVAMAAGHALFVYGLRE
jgi:alcohol dehydrogenase (cytochrome c)